MVNIKLNDEWRLKSDKLNWFLQRMADGRHGAEPAGTWVTEGYYETIGGLFKAFYRLRLRLSDAESWLELHEHAAETLGIVNKQMDNPVIQQELDTMAELINRGVLR
jgi:hypothetical protein